MRLLIARSNPTYSNQIAQGISQLAQVRAALEEASEIFFLELQTCDIKGAVLGYALVPTELRVDRGMSRVSCS
jgi:hypothetical protein